MWLTPFVYRSILCLGLLIAYCLPLQLFASVKQSSVRMTDPSNLRQITIAFVTRYYSGPRMTYSAEKLKTMEDFLTEMAKVDLLDTSVYYSIAEFRNFPDHPPRILTLADTGELPVIDESVLNYPIGFSFAVYKNLESTPAASTPLLWTRNLHRYEDFDESYGGFVAFLDGYVRYFEGTPNNHNPELVELFGKEGRYAQAIRVLSSVPTEWDLIKPLPVAVNELASTQSRDFMTWILWLTPASVAGILSLIFSRRDRSLWSKARGASLVFAIVLIATLVLVPTTG